jgi:DNA-binding response OmpR family regulator
MLRRLVCIEDDPELIELIRLIVQRSGFEVYEAAGGLAGIELVEELKPDLVLLDLMMPGIDGWEVFDHLQANVETNTIPIIVVTARTYLDERVAELRAADDGHFVSKPFAPVQLMEAIHRVLPGA